MYLLATDTSGRDGSIALARCEQDGSCDILEIVPLAGGMFSAQLVPQVIVLLASHRLRKQDIDAFAVASGPGSFTGLRIGLAAIKGLAEILDKPIAAVSLLEALAHSTTGQGRVIAALDAGRGEFYTGIYESDGVSWKLASESLLTQSELLHSAVDCVLVTPEPVLVAAARGHGVEVMEVERPRSDAIARLGWKKILAGEVVSPEALDANYIRRAVT